MNALTNFNDWAKGNRRAFLQWSLATGLGLHGIAFTSFAETSHFSPSEFERVRHPISPERVVVMTGDGGDGWHNRDCRVEASLRASLIERFNLSTGKLDVIVRLMRVMTDYYRVPHLLPSWATGLAWRESLGSTGVGQGFGLLHQFQDDGSVQLESPPADWWLVLFPEGIDWESWEPVYGMIGHVFPSDHRQHPGMTLRAYCVATTAGRVIGQEMGNWSRLAKFPRRAAAQFVNDVILTCGREQLQEMAELAKNG